MPAPAFNAVGTRVTTATRTETVAPGLPASWATGHIHLLGINIAQYGATVSDANTETLFGISGGWNLALTGYYQDPTLANSRRGRLYIYWRRAEVGDEAPVISMNNGSTGTEWVLHAGIAGYSGCIATGTPFEAATFRDLGNAGTDWSAAGITTLGVNRRVFLLMGAGDDRAVAPAGVSNVAATDPATFTSRLNENTTAGADSFLGILDAERVSAGATGNITGDFGDTDPTGLAMLALIPSDPDPEPYDDGEVSGTVEIDSDYSPGVFIGEFAGTGTISITGTSAVADQVESPSASLAMQPFWRPWAVGNGRIWLHGVVLPDSEPIPEIQYRVNGSHWITAFENPEPGDRVIFPVTGDQPSEWGTERPVMVQVGTNLYEAPLNFTPKFVWVNGNRSTKRELAELNGTVRGWHFDEVSGILTIGTTGTNVPTVVNAVHDPVFLPGSTYTVEVRANSSLPKTLFLETFNWLYTTRDYVTRYLRVMLPTVLRDDPFFQSLYIAYAKKAADALIFFEDIAAQFYPQFATWGLSLWEDQVGVPSYPNLTTAERRAIILSRRQVGSTKEEFFQRVTSLVPGGGIEITEQYDIQRVNIRLPVGANNTEIRRALEVLINQIKPAGIEVIVSYSGFFADISEAGDIL